MITITNRYNCDYLVFDEPINIEPKVLISKYGINIEPGMKISQIGCGTGCRDIVVDNLVLFSPHTPQDKKKAEIKKYEKSAGKKCSNVQMFQQTKNSIY